MVSEYRLSRARSASALPRSASVQQIGSVSSLPIGLLPRSSSVSDVNCYYRWSQRYKPQWSLIYNYSPHYYGNSYYRASPISYKYMHTRHYADNLPNAGFADYPFSYWTRHKSYLYDYNYPYYSVPYYRNRYLAPYNKYYSPYNHYYY
ncbi:hypothetical protein M3Y97_00872600 [Aphelenchoides bicaudatus]|nr:hypothetical protein M3Y97_00872600 [Aphelenchoides bicaudatus]